MPTTIRPGTTVRSLSNIAGAAYAYGKEEATTSEEMVFAAGVLALAEHLIGHRSGDQVMDEILAHAEELGRN